MNGNWKKQEKNCAVTNGIMSGYLAVPAPLLAMWDRAGCAAQWSSGCRKKQLECRTTVVGGGAP